MYRKLFFIAVAAALLLAFPAETQVPRPAEPVPPPATLVEPVPKAPAPAFNAGDLVIDRLGVSVGAVETLTESPTGMIVVVKIDGKMIGVPSSTLRRRGDSLVSSQSKAEMIAAAGLPANAAEAARR